MIKLIGVNLLPYRELARQAKQREFARLLAFAAVVGLVLAGLVWFFLNQLISNQDGRNQYLQDEIKVLDKQIEEVKTLKQQKAEFLTRKQKIEELQNERFKAAMFLNDLNRMMPEGVYLTKIQSVDGVVYTLTGRALSDSKVAVLMNSLPSTGIFDVPELVEIKTDNGSQQFTLKTSLVQAVAGEVAKPQAAQ